MTCYTGKSYKKKRPLLKVTCWRKMILKLHICANAKYERTKHLCNKRYLEHIQIRSHLAAQLLSGSMTEMILQCNPRNVVNQCRRANNRNSHREREKMKGEEKQPIKIWSSAFVNKVAIFIHLEEGAVLATVFSELHYHSCLWFYSSKGRKP